jgi:hypothetical protein
MYLKKYDLEKIIPFVNKLFTLALNRKEEVSAKIINEDNADKNYLECEISGYYFTIHDNGNVELWDAYEHKAKNVRNLPEVMDMMFNSQWIYPNERLPECHQEIVAKFVDDGDIIIRKCTMIIYNELGIRKTSFINRNCDYLYQTLDSFECWLPANRVKGL